MPGGKTETEFKEIAQPSEVQKKKSDSSQPAAALAAGQPEKTGKQGKSPSWLAMAAVSLLISAVISAGSVYVYDRYYAQKIIAVDIKGYIAGQKDLYLAGKINDEQFRANVDKMVAAVKSIPKNRVAIMGDAVIRNAEIEKLP